MNFSKIWDTDWVDDSRTKSEYNFQMKWTWYYDLLRCEMKLMYQTMLLNGETLDTNDNEKTKMNTKHMKPDNDVTQLG